MRVGVADRGTSDQRDYCYLCGRHCGRNVLLMEGIEAELENGGGGIGICFYKRRLYGQAELISDIRSGRVRSDRLSAPVRLMAE